MGATGYINAARTLEVQRICEHTCEAWLSASVGQEPEVGSA